MKKLILMAIFTHFLINAANAYREYNWLGWDTNSWYSSKIGKTRFRDPSLFAIVSTNNPMYIHVVKVVVTQDFSVTSPLPNYNPSNDTIQINVMKYGWRRDYGAYDNPFEGMTFRVKNSNDYYNVITCYYFVAASTNYSWWNDVVVPCAQMYKLGFGFLKYLTNNVDYFYEERFIPIELVGTNLLLDASEIRILDTYNAIDFFYRVTSANPNTFPLFLVYGQERYALQNIKNSLAAMFTTGNASPVFPQKHSSLFVGCSAATALDWNLNTNAILLSSDEFRSLQYLGLPTNYFSYTPYRNLTGSAWGIPHILTNEYTIRTTKSGIVTQQFTDYLGIIHSCVGTNKQSFTFIVTNNAIKSGFTSADYGWKNIPQIISNLNYVLYYCNARSAYFNTNKQPFYYGKGYTEDGSWENAIYQATTNFANWPVNYTSSYFSGVGYRYTASIVSNWDNWISDNPYAACVKYKSGSTREVKFFKMACDSLLVEMSYPAQFYKITNYNIAADVYLLGTMMLNSTGTYYIQEYTNSCWDFLHPKNPDIILDKKTIYFTNMPQWIEFTNVFNKYDNTTPEVGTLPSSDNIYYLSGWQQLISWQRYHIVIHWKHAWTNVITE